MAEEEHTAFPIPGIRTSDFSQKPSRQVGLAAAEAQPTASVRRSTKSGKLKLGIGMCRGGAKSTTAASSVTSKILFQLAGLSTFNIGINTYKTAIARLARSGDSST